MFIKNNKKIKCKLNNPRLSPFHLTQECCKVLFHNHLIIHVFQFMMWEKADHADHTLLEIPFSHGQAHYYFIRLIYFGMQILKKKENLHTIFHFEDHRRLHLQCLYMYNCYRKINVFGMNYTNSTIKQHQYLIFYYVAAGLHLK